MSEYAVCRIMRTGEVPYEQEYKVPWEKGMTLLAALKYINSQIDPSMAIPGVFCKRGICGGCMVICNGKRVMACRMLLNLEVYSIKAANDEKIIRDLVIDQSWTGAVSSVEGKEKSNG